MYVEDEVAWREAKIEGLKFEIWHKIAKAFTLYDHGIFDEKFQEFVMFSHPHVLLFKKILFDRVVACRCEGWI